MTERGIEMIDAIQGPPRWPGPDVLLRQTSFRALAEPRAMRTPDGEVISGALRVRFGEVEARGIALTRQGRARYDALLARVDELDARDPQADRADVARALWTAELPGTEHGLAAQGLAHFTYHVVPGRPADGSRPPAGLDALLDQGWVRAEPIVYEDFLPRSAAGIFQSTSATKAPGTTTAPVSPTTAPGSPAPSDAKSWTPSTSTRNSRTAPSPRSPENSPWTVFPADPADPSPTLPTQGAS